MKDTVAVALITGGSTAAIGAVGNVISWATGRRAADLEAARLENETERLRLVQSEESRRHRQELYVKFLCAGEELDSMASGFSPADEPSFDAWSNHFWPLVHEVELLGPTQVVEAVEQFLAYEATIHDDLKFLSAAFEESLRESWAHRKEEFLRLLTQVREAMREDVANFG